MVIIIMNRLWPVPLRLAESSAFHNYPPLPHIYRTPTCPPLPSHLPTPSFPPAHPSLLTCPPLHFPSACHSSPPCQRLSSHLPTPPLPSPPTCPHLPSHLPTPPIPSRPLPPAQASPPLPSPPTCPCLPSPPRPTCPHLPSHLPTYQCLQHLCVCLPNPQHDGALCDEAGNSSLGMTQHIQALLVLCSRVPHQPWEERRRGSYKSEREGKKRAVSECLQGGELVKERSES